MTFKHAVESTPGLKGAWRVGLRALKRADQKHVDAEDTRRLKGSLDVDTTLISAFPNDPRWDYGIGHQPRDVNGEVVYWIEVHPASDGNVKEVIAKLEWLKEWLAGSAPLLHAMRRRYVWVSSGKTSLTLTPPQRKRLAQLGLEHKGRVFVIPDEFN